MRLRVLRPVTVLIGLWGFTLLQGCGSVDQSDSQLQRARQPGTGGGSKEGKKCEVVKGPNKGETGTYDDEGWCMGDWGGTECTDSNGKDNGKCKDAKKVIVVKPIIIGGGVKMGR